MAGSDRCNRQKNDEVLGFDDFGNPTGRAYDLGGVDDQRLRGERILFCAAYELYRQSAQQLVVPAVASRNLQMDVVTPTELKASLKKTLFRSPRLSEYTQLWYMSDSHAFLDEGEVKAIDDFNRAGGGLFIWADNDPYFADANALARAIVGTTFSGNMQADGILKPGTRLQPGIFIEHPLTSGLNTLYEGITICTVNPAEGVTLLARSHDGQNCMACYERERRRVVLDTGFTKIAGESYFNRTPGTARYVRNIAFWLAKGIRDSSYKLLTTPEQLATISQDQWSGDYAFDLKSRSTLAFVLVWHDGSELRLDVQTPAGAAHSTTRSSSSPLRTEAPDASPGLWRCRVKGVRVPGPACRYVLTVVERKSATPSVAATLLVLESHPIPKPEWRVSFAGHETRLDLMTTSFRVRASIERQADGSVQLVVHPGGDVRVQVPGSKRWVVHPGGTRIALPDGTVFFDNQGKATVRVRQGDKK